jgi:hypothetical protein
METVLPPRMVAPCELLFVQGKRLLARVASYNDGGPGDADGDLQLIQFRSLFIR